MSLGKRPSLTGDIAGVASSGQSRANPDPTTMKCPQARISTGTSDVKHLIKMLLRLTGVLRDTRSKNGTTVTATKAGMIEIGMMQDITLANTGMFLAMSRKTSTVGRKERDIARTVIGIALTSIETDKDIRISCCHKQAAGGQLLSVIDVQHAQRWLRRCVVFIICLFAGNVATGA